MKWLAVGIRQGLTFVLLVMAWRGAWWAAPLALTLLAVRAECDDLLRQLDEGKRP